MTDRTTLQTLAGTGSLAEFRDAIAAAGDLPRSARQALEFILAARSGEFAAAKAMVPLVAGASTQMREGIASTLRQVPERSDPRFAVAIDELVAALDRGGSGSAAAWRELPRRARLAIAAAVAMAVGLSLGILARPSLRPHDNPEKVLGVYASAAGETDGSDTAGDVGGTTGSGYGSGASSGYGRKPEAPSAGPVPTAVGDASSARPERDPGSASAGPSVPDPPAAPASAGDSPAGPGLDSDQDGVPDAEDPCPEIAHERKADLDLDGVPDACDNCRFAPNTRGADGKQADVDEDGVGDACDNCPGWKTASTWDIDGDGVGDDCECKGGITDSSKRGMRGVDCDEDGMPLGPAPSPPVRVSFASDKDARQAIAAVISAWESREEERGSDRECATVRVAFGTLAGAIDRLVFDLRVQRDEILLVHQAAIAQGDILERHDAALKVSDRIREIGDPFTPCLALLQQVCVKAPQACLEGHPIEESGLGSIGSRLDFVAKEFGRPQFKFRGDASKPRAFLESTRQGLLMIRGLWADYLRDIQTSLDPPPKRYSPIP